MEPQTEIKSILDSLITSVIVLDDKLRIQHMNSSAEDLLGLSEDKVKGKPLESCIQEGDDSAETLIQVLETGSTLTKRRSCWLLQNQAEITVDYSATPVNDGRNLIVEIQPLDRLLRISREEALLTSQETTRNLVRSMAHEIKNPLGGIRGAAQLLSRELRDPGLEEYTRIIIRETDRLRDLIDRMLGPRQPMKREAVNVHEILEHVHAVIRAGADSAIDTKRDYDPSIPEIPGDRQQLIQAVLNISLNAVQALIENPEQKNPTITFRTRIQRRFTIGHQHHPLVAKMSIIDNGPGIPPDIAEHIFYPMITGRANGTGLGLAISQNLISQHEGLVTCQSEQGTTEFAIYLPLESNYANA